MVARIDTSNYLRHHLEYNEAKVSRGQAELILAANFFKDPQELTHREKLTRFEHRNDLNARSLKNTLHVKLSFHPLENLSNEKLASIAERYMEGLRLPDQPCLVYRHLDTSIPHIHLVSSLIRPDGSRFRTQNIGRLHSEKARRMIEKEFGLIPAGEKLTEKISPTSAPAKILDYGKSPTLASMQQVLHDTLHNYKYPSLEAFNAVLRSYNMMADRGLPGSKTYQHRGLTYKILDAEGKPTGTPIKASRFPERPTLDRLEKKFRADKISLQSSLQPLRNRIEWALRQSAGHPDHFLDKLTRDQTEAFAAVSPGSIKSLVFVDHKNKIALPAEDLGPGYSSPEILARLQLKELPAQNLQKKKGKELSQPLRQVLKDLAIPLPSDNPQQHQNLKLKKR